MGIFCASMGSRNSQILFLFVFVAFNAFLYFLSVPVYEKGEMLSPTYKYAADGQRYWGAAVNLAERGEFVIRTAGPKIYYSYQEKKPPTADLPLAKAANISRQARTVREEPLTRAGPLPALVFSIPMKLVGFERAAVVIVSLQCALLFATGLLARSLAGPFRSNGNLVQGLLIFNPNLISLAHHAQSEIIFVFLFTSILWFCSKYIFAFSLPWPIFSPLYAYQAPDFSTTSALEPKSINSPDLLIPLPYIKSNSTTLNGGETLFLTTLTRVALPTICSLSLIAPILLMSILTEE